MPRLASWLIDCLSALSCISGFRPLPHEVVISVNDPDNTLKVSSSHPLCLVVLITFCKHKIKRVESTCSDLQIEMESKFVLKRVYFMATAGTDDKKRKLEWSEGRFKEGTSTDFSDKSWLMPIFSLSQYWLVNVADSARDYKQSENVHAMPHLFGQLV